MTDRIRSTYLDEMGGSASRVTANTNIQLPDVAVACETTLCEDVVAIGDCYPFKVEKWHRKGCRIEYHSASNDFNNYVADVMRHTSVYGHLSVGGIPTNAMLAAQVAARTSPSRPYVDVLVNVLEMADIARLIKKTGDNLFKELARNNLRYNFGIVPIVSDLTKMIDFQEQVERRCLEIERLRGPRGLRRTVKLGTWSNLGIENNKTIQSAVMLVHQDITKRTVVTIKGHARWKAGYSTRKLLAPDMRRLARKALLGMTIHPSVFWEAFPFSWLVDWATNLGDILKSQRNVIPAQLEIITISRHTRTETLGRGGHYDNGAFVSSLHGLKDTKIRTPVSLTPSAHFPFLSGKQMGILASLAIMRA